MCGIIGGIYPGISEELASKQLRQIAHRGPDDSGIYIDEQCWLGHVRLSILDLSIQGHQPMSTTDGLYTIVYNGEIYNHQELRTELAASGYSFHSTSDTETLLYAYAAWGEQCLNKLNGIYAFAIADKKNDTLFIARDPLGVKPLYYYHGEKHLLFCSEIKGFLNSEELDLSTDKAAYYPYLLLLYGPGRQTPFKKVQKLLPGHCITVPLNTPAAPVQRKYTAPMFNGRYNATLTEEAWINRLDEVLTNAVKRQLLSDAPLGFFLSGGLDSGLILAIARKLLPGKPLKAFTIDTQNLFPEEGFTEDLPYAKKLAQLLGADLEIIPANGEILQHFDSMIWHLDEPQTDPAALFVAQIATTAHKQGIKVLLGGTGADDIFSGYKRHQALQLERFTDYLPPLVRKSISNMAAMLPEHNPKVRRAKKLMRNAPLTGMQRRISYHYWMQPDEVKALFRPEIQNTLDDHAPENYFSSLLNEIPGEHDPLNQMLYWEMRGFLADHNLNYTDKMGMAAGVEIRVPFLDKELVELAATMPPALKMKGRQTKYILKKLAERYLPKEIIYRPKTGFGAPLRSWIQRDMQPVIRQYFSEEYINRSGIFDYNALQQLLHDNDTGKRDASYIIWAVLAVLRWQELFTDGKTAADSIKLYF
ncbi:asparagine synthase (glutamine-hydrolyzing) [Chitinophagaceae bacterium MMS25-I14]